MSTYEDWDMFTDLAAITQWLDKYNVDTPGDDAMRVMKIGEEIAEAYRALAAIDVTFGRAVEAYIGMTGQNPRKGTTHTQADLCNELADVAITALCAMMHFTSSGYGTYNPNIVRSFVASKVAAIIKRSDITPITGLIRTCPPIRPHDYTYDGIGPEECTFTELTGEKCGTTETDHAPNVAEGN